MFNNEITKIKTNEEWLKEFEKLLEVAVLYAKPKTFREEERLYTGSNCGGYLPPLRAIYNLKQSCVILDVPINREIAIQFMRCIEYAKIKLKDYSCFLCGANIPTINMPIVGGAGRIQ